MSLEAIKSISAAEEKARAARHSAQQKADELIEEAVRAGKEAVAATLARAESEIAHLKRASDQKAAEQAKELASATANRQAALRARAESRLEQAAGLIVERIVNV